MKSNPSNYRAFTLIEMLIVISIIGILAALIFPVAGVIKRNGTLKRARAELTQLETAIESYKQKLGHYPPADTNNPALNPLYFELLGTTSANSLVETLDGTAKISEGNVKIVFGVDGFANFGTRKAEEGVVAENFLKSVKPGNVGQLTTPVSPDAVKVFVGPVAWPASATPPPIATSPELNPWRYVSANPTNNPQSYDLWVDLIIGGKKYRVSNWRRDPEVNPMN